MEYTQIISLVPAGEHFDASAINEGIWVSQAHFANIENRLADNATTLATSLEEATAATEAALAAAREAEANLQTATDANAASAQTITDLQARITELENAPAGSFATTAKDKDDIGGAGNKAKSAVDIEADRLRAMRGE